MPQMAFFAARGEVLLMSKEAESDRMRIYKTSDRSHVFLNENMARPRTHGDESLLIEF